MPSRLQCSQASSRTGTGQLTSGLLTVFLRAVDLTAADFEAVQRKMRQRGLRCLHRHGNLDDHAIHTLDTADHAGGWSIHAGVTIPGWDRRGLERLVRYCARPPLSQERLGRLNDSSTETDETDDKLISTLSRAAARCWALLLVRIYERLPLLCPRCGEPMRIIAFVQDPPVIDGLTGGQRFFLAWAQVWRSQQREDNARRQLRTDSHSPEQFRVNGVVCQMDAWYRAFDVSADDDLYLPPEERVTIW